ncbi:hypothetical protein [Laspinema olomoucense]|uniref:hypothetical protein n=1 Tax=Laspinema olomoucense TaxID=3231600 RepID=UPI0021BBAADF|nr:hypothetical protein [Laspinema sp. D3c]MCT7995930.1 hypothetical protein [Laspinema sp. D3c]
MKRFEPKRTIRPTPEAKGYLDVLKKNQTFSRAIDAYVFAGAYAIKKNADISPVPSQGRQDLIYVGIVDDEVRLALEAGIHTICQRNGQPEPKDSGEAMEIFTQYAEAGIKLLKERWEGKTRGQIQNDILKIIEEETGSPY